MFTVLDDKAAWFGACSRRLQGSFGNILLTNDGPDQKSQELLVLRRKLTEA